MVGVFLNHSQPYFLRQSPSLILELTDSGRLANECQEPTCLLPISFLGLYTHTQYLVFHVSTGHLTEVLMLGRETLYRMNHFPNTRG